MFPVWLVQQRFDDDSPTNMEVKKTDKPGSLSPVKPTLKRDTGDEDRRSRSSSKSEKELRPPPEKSPSDDGSLRRERKLSKASDGSKETFERWVIHDIRPSNNSQAIKDK